MLAIANGRIEGAQIEPDTQRRKFGRGIAIVVGLDDDGEHLQLGAPLEVLNPMIDQPIHEGEPLNLVPVPSSPGTPRANLGLYFALKA